MTDIAERAKAAALEIECKKDSLRQNQDGTWKLVLTVAPDGLPDPIMKAPPGVRYRAFFVEVDDTEEPVNHAPAAPKRDKTPFHEKPYSVQAGIRCSDPRFAEFLSMKFPTAWRDEAEEHPYFHESAAIIVRSACGVDSRKQLDDPDAPMARERWKALNAEFEKWAGLVPEAR